MKISSKLVVEKTRLQETLKGKVYLSYNNTKTKVLRLSPTTTPNLYQSFSSQRAEHHYDEKINVYNLDISCSRLNQYIDLLISTLIN